MKYSKKLLWLLVIPVLFLLVFLQSCQKDNNNRNDIQRLDVFLTDGPARFDAVNIEILSIEAKVDTSVHRGDDNHGDNDGHDDDHDDHDDFGYWTTLNFTPGIYDVLQLRNGVDSMIASANLNGTVRKLRITIGTNNSVVDSGVTHPLNLLDPSNNQIYVSLKNRHRGHHGQGSQSVWIDFDLGRSISIQNGQYYLSPRVHPFCDDNFGEIEGKVLPLDANAFVTAFNATDTATAIPFNDGKFKIRGLEPGNYTLFIDGTAPYQDTTLYNVVVDTRHETEVGTITLRQ